MLKILFLCIIFTSACVSNQTKKIGGWYPVFFKEYNQQELNNILNKLKSDNVCAVISYPKEKLNLASNIKKFFQDNGLIIENKESDCVDDKLQQCDHESVVITVWTGYDSSQCTIKKYTY